MGLVGDAIVLVGTPEKAGASREGKPVELIVVVDDPRHAQAAIAASSADEGAQAPNYYLDQLGTVHQFVADSRAGNGLELATFRTRRRNLDRISLSVRLERPEGVEYSDAQVAALHRLLAVLCKRHGLDEQAFATILPDEEGRPRVYPYLPPPPSMTTGELLGATLEPDQVLFVALFAETYRPRGGALKLDQAFPLHAAKFDLGAPVGQAEIPPVTVAGHTYNLQPFARDVLFNQGTDYAAVMQLSSLGDPERTEIPAAGPGRVFLEAAYLSAIKAARAAGVPIKGRETLEPGWRFHQVAHNAGYGPPLTGNCVSDDGKHAVQVFAGETLYTPLSDQAGCMLLSCTEPSDPAYASIWAETYKVAGAPYIPEDAFHRRAVELKLGAPLTGVYDTNLAGANYKVQVWARDTLYQGPDMQIRRMSELAKPPAVQAWQPAPPKPVPPTPPNPLPPAVAAGSAGSPRPNDISWPPRPDFGILSDRGGARERVLGRIEYMRARGDFVRITNGWDAHHIVDVKIPQLHKIPGVRFDTLKCHRVAAEQLQRLWAAWEAAGLLHLIKTFDGCWVVRTIRLKPTVLSNHAYGTAFDINANWNGLMRVAALVGQPGSVRELVPIANAHGFYWGGHWNFDGNGASDGMHFEWARPA